MILSRVSPRQGSSGLRLRGGVCFFFFLHTLYLGVLCFFSVLVVRCVRSALVLTTLARRRCQCHVPGWSRSRKPTRRCVQRRSRVALFSFPVWCAL